MRKLTNLAVLIISILSCSKDSDIEKPVITITSPLPNQQFTAGQIVTVSATVTDNDGLHEVHLFVTNKANNASVVHSEEHPDMKSYTLSKSFTAQAGVTYTIKLEANDHAGNEAEAELEVKGN